ncbi:hypothetical protein H2O64_18535 [Kordia sp. YSTF-M3]|uniref:Uncharacterized protein n=1 Tax=Kordia aestuariivivens TaxID=2759037 RepID=A0ABR7QDL5_9FLAO|nr:hypothetical protein [Kordia aestuariivivens]MBC8756677.1 hypothetical protein [Kordia aestuariivivens]
MKKYITLFTFICVLFLGIQTATAQDDPLETMAKDKTTALAKALDLSPAQVKLVFEIYYTAYEKNNGIISKDVLNGMRKKISAVLQPAQLEEFKISLNKEKERQDKIEGANGG